MTSLRILGSRIDQLSFAEALARIAGFTAEPGAHHVITGNTLMLLDAERDCELQAVLENAALVIPESSGIYWASRWLRRPLREFIPGIDLMLALCAHTTQSVYLLGAKPGVAAQAADELRRRFPGLRIAGCHHGYFSETESVAILEHVRSTRPGLLFVAMSVPAQEKWIAAHLHASGAAVVMGVGGSFDVLAGRLQRAPAWMRRLGVEWLFRLYQEPWRWRRIARLPVFAMRVLANSCRA